MNRQILFKAKRTDWEELPKDQWWVEGYLFDDGMPEPKHYFIGGIIVKLYEGTACDKWNVVGIDFCEIDINTICQYTGLTGKYGKKIWENDILRGYQYPYRSDGNDNYFAEVTWFENCPAFGIYTFKNPKSNVCGISEGNTEFMENWNSEDWEVIGNIFDNTDLLEVE